MWYPSIGNLNYPYIPYSRLRSENAWDLLGRLALVYTQVSRGLRNRFSWSPSVIDDIEVHRLCQIFEEAVEDSKKENNPEEY